MYKLSFNLICMTIHTTGHFFLKVRWDGKFYEFNNMKPFTFQETKEIDLEKDMINYIFYSDYYE